MWKLIAIYILGVNILNTSADFWNISCERYPSKSLSRARHCLRLSVVTYWVGMAPAEKGDLSSAHNRGTCRLAHHSNILIPQRTGLSLCAYSEEHTCCQYYNPRNFLGLRKWIKPQTGSRLSGYIAILNNLKMCWDSAINHVFVNILLHMGITGCWLFGMWFACMCKETWLLQIVVHHGMKQLNLVLQWHV